MKIVDKVIEKVLGKLKRKFFLLIFLIIVTGCTFCRPNSKVLIWDYERDVTTNTSHLIPDNYSSSYKLGGIIQKGILLSPKGLMRVFQASFLPKTIVTNRDISKVLETMRSSFTISESNEGQIITNWSPIVGRTVGMFGWEKTYETEVRHTITIMRSYYYNKLTNYSITSEVRERPNNKYPWKQVNPELGRASFEHLKNLLLVVVDKELAKIKKETKK